MAYARLGLNRIELNPVPVYNDKVFISSISSTTSREGLENFMEWAFDVPADITYGDKDGTALVTFDRPVGK